MSLTYNKDALKAKADEDCLVNDTTVTQLLGFGSQGMVFKTQRNSAIKVHSLETGYLRERDIYKRLKDKGIRSICEMMIPRISNWSDRLFIFEMSVVHVPCIIDFGGAYLDEAPDHIIWCEMKFGCKRRPMNLVRTGNRRRQSLEN